MGNNNIFNTNKVLMATALLSSLLLSLVHAQFENPPAAGPPGKPCSSSFQCWRTEPINVFGEPVGLMQGNRRKRLEVGSSFSKGGRCRCIEGTCAQFQQRTQSFLPCEEF